MRDESRRDDAPLADDGGAVPDDMPLAPDDAAEAEKAAERPARTERQEPEPRPER